MKLLPVSDLQEGYNPRRTFETEELKKSIQQHGILVPLLVRKEGEEYLIVSGTSRYRVAKELGIAEVPCLVRELSAEIADHLAFVDNAQRKNLSPFETGCHYAHMRDEYGWTQRKLAEEIGVSKTDIDRYLQISTLDLAPLMGQLSMMHLYELSKLVKTEALKQLHQENSGEQWEKAYETDLNARRNRQESLAQLAIDQEWTVKKLADEVKHVLNEFERRDEEIKLKEKEKADKIYKKMRDSVTSFSRDLLALQRKQEQFREATLLYERESFDVLPIESKQEILNVLDDLEMSLDGVHSEELRENIQTLKQKIGAGQ